MTACYRKGVCQIQRRIKTNRLYDFYFCQKGRLNQVKRGKGYQMTKWVAVGCNGLAVGCNGLVVGLSRQVERTVRGLDMSICRRAEVQVVNRNS
jgi:hypothetical protein